MSILLANGWVAGDTVPDSCSPGSSPDFLDTTNGALYSCVGGVYLPVTPIANGGVLETRAVTVFNYKADTQHQNISDPGKGKLRWNTTGQIDATSIIFDRLTNDGFDISLQLQLLGPTSRLIIQATDLALNYQVWALTSPVVVLPDFFQAPVALVTSQGNAVFKNNEPISVLR